MNEQCERHSGLTASILNSGLSKAGSTAGHGHCVVLLGKICTPMLTLNTQECKLWVAVM